ncbi:hypothetical protein CAPTEDRAFT_211699 [Capitella teleta]|uniref:Uncharacterized protein n=1 Tax=Capitella teleta TaxID=283909 RepID=R7URI5_CAPTE|nr:hypothetical protein CAPTEDRAFT_211699 [Capitella teleta]|eukprot:ELU09114.1 hypothetical protein CAPTEDRAFT_211699 [Capitella teleta]
MASCTKAPNWMVNARSEYSEKRQRANGRYNNLLSHQFQEIEKARKLAKADIIYEKKTIQQDIKRRSSLLPSGVIVDKHRQRTLQERLKADQLAHTQRIRHFLSVEPTDYDVDTPRKSECGAMSERIGIEKDRIEHKMGHKKDHASKKEVIRDAFVSTLRRRRSGGRSGPRVHAGVKNELPKQHLPRHLAPIKGTRTSTPM